MSDIPDEEDNLDRLVSGGTAVAVQTVYDNFFLAKLAQEVAMNIRELPAILEIYKISEERYREIEAIPFFKAALDQYVIEWNSAKNAAMRLKIEAATGLEQGMPVMSARLQDKTEDLGKVAEIAKLFAKITGVDAVEKQQGNPGDKFSITINLGEDVKLKFDKDVTPVEPIKEIEAAPNEH